MWEERNEKEKKFILIFFFRLERFFGNFYKLNCRIKKRDRWNGIYYYGVGWVEENIYVDREFVILLFWFCMVSICFVFLWIISFVCYKYRILSWW